MVADIQNAIPMSPMPAVTRIGLSTLCANSQFGHDLPQQLFGRLVVGTPFKVKEFYFHAFILKHYSTNRCLNTWPLLSLKKLLRFYRRRIERRPHGDITPMIRLSVRWIHARSRRGWGSLSRDIWLRGSRCCRLRPRRRIERRPHGDITPVIRLSVRWIHARSCNRLGGHKRWSLNTISRRDGRSC